MAKNNKTSNTGNVPVCYTNIQPANVIKSTLEEHVYLDSNLVYNQGKKASQQAVSPNKLILPSTYADGAVIIGNSTFFNKYQQLLNLADGMEDGPKYVDTRDDNVTIHNGKKASSPSFTYTYNGGSGELLEFSISTKYTQTVEAVKCSTINPDDKSIETKTHQGIQNTESTIKTAPIPVDSAFYARRPTRNGTPGLYTVVPDLGSRILVTPKDYQEYVTDENTYSSVDDAKAGILHNVQLTEAEVRDFNSRWKAKWDKFEKDLKAYQDALKSDPENKTNIQPPYPPYKVDDFTIRRKVKVLLDYKAVMSYSTLDKHAYGGNPDFWKSGFEALVKSKDITVIPKSGNGNRQYLGYSPGNYWGKDPESVLVEMDINIDLPGARIVADPLFLTLGDTLPNNLVKSMESQVKAKAKFVGNPLMESSQVVHVNNVGNAYSGEWYTKEVTHEIDSGGGYITTVSFEKKSSSIILNSISTKINTQRVFKEAHDVGVESYKTQAWKKPDEYEAIVKARREKYTKEVYLYDPSGYHIPTVQITGIVEDDGSITTINSDKDFRVDMPINPTK